jgi:hypothetical protein
MPTASTERAPDTSAVAGTANASAVAGTAITSAASTMSAAPSIARAVPSTHIGRVLLVIDIVDAATLTRQYVIDTTTAREKRRAR